MTRTERWSFVLAAALSLSIAAAPPAALAHPHVWIEVRVAVLFDAGRVVGLRQSWRFDTFYTIAATKELPGDGGADPLALTLLMTDILAGLAEVNAFTELSLNGQPLSIGLPIGEASAIRDDRLTMTFTVPVSEPAALNSADVLSYRIYDPSYLIELSHDGGAAAVDLDGAPAGCVATLTRADPDPSEAAFAAALDSGGGSQAATGIGALFADTATIACR